jgi:hypothetical protein
MSPSEIETIRSLRGFGVAWPVIAKQLQKSVAECRQAIGMPEYSEAASEPAPWIERQRDLFSQPQRDGISER